MNADTTWPIGVCSWSLQCDTAELPKLLEDLTVDHVHLGLKPFLEMDDAAEFINQQPWTLSCLMVNFDHEDYSTLETIKLTGGIVPDDQWEKALDEFKQAIALSKTLDCDLLSFHAGFIDASNGAFEKLCNRIKMIADLCADAGLTLLLETGQETATELASFLRHMNHPALGVNFDPANMVLYDKGDPIEALKVLSPWIRHVHVKDATRTTVPGEWGTEVAWGTGDVNATEFLKALTAINYTGALAIEREAGANRFGDIQAAKSRLAQFSENQVLNTR